MSPAWDQLLLNEPCGQYVMINTHEGLHCYTCLTIMIVIGIRDLPVSDDEELAIDILIVGPDDNSHVAVL